MKKPILINILLHPLYLLSLFLLITNDWLWKEMFHNALTGKLSDFVGLFIFPIFFSVLMPKQIKTVHIVTALGFVFWKTAFSQPLIDFIYWQGWQIERVIDYADLIALVSIIGSYHFIEYQKMEKLHLFTIPRMSLTYFVLGISFFAFCATSPIRPSMINMMADYNLEEDIYSDLTEKEIIENLETKGYIVKKGMALRPVDSLRMQRHRLFLRKDILKIDSSEAAVNCWYLQNVVVKNDTLQALNILISEQYNKDRTRIKLLGMCVDSTTGYFLPRKEIKKYDKYLKRKILRKVK